MDGNLLEAGDELCAVCVEALVSGTASEELGVRDEAEPDGTIPFKAVLAVAFSTAV